MFSRCILNKIVLYISFLVYYVVIISAVKIEGYIIRQLPTHYTINNVLCKLLC